MSQGLATASTGLSHAFIPSLSAATFLLSHGVMGVLNLTRGALFLSGALVVPGCALEEIGWE